MYKLKIYTLAVIAIKYIRVYIYMYIYTYNMIIANIQGCILLPFSLQSYVAPGSSLVKVTFTELPVITTPPLHIYT